MNQIAIRYTADWRIATTTLNCPEGASFRQHADEACYRALVQERDSGEPRVADVSHSLAPSSQTKEE